MAVMSYLCLGCVNVNVTSIVIERGRCRIIAIAMTNPVYSHVYMLVNIKYVSTKPILPSNQVCLMELNVIA